MADRKENSVLVHLQELKGIEEQRVAEEEEQRRQREQERIRAQMELEQRARAEEEARRQAIIRAEQERRENEERRLREEQLKVAAERRLATVHEEAKQDQQRLSQEMEMLAQKASKAKPVTLSIIALLLVGAVAFLGNHLHQQRKEAAARELAYEQRLEAIRVEISKVQRELDGLFAERRALRDRRIRATLDDVPQIEQGLGELETKIQNKKAELRSKKGELSNPAAVQVKPITPSPAPAPAKQAAPATGVAPAPAAPTQPAPAP